MGPYLSTVPVAVEQDDSYSYTLFAVVNHKGTCLCLKGFFFFFCSFLSFFLSFLMYVYVSYNFFSFFLSFSSRLSLSFFCPICCIMQSVFFNSFCLFLVCDREFAEWTLHLLCAPSTGGMIAILLRIYLVQIS